MEIMVYTPSDDTNKIVGFTIVVDVLRAFSVSYYIIENNPKRYIITDSIEHAFFLRSRIKDSVLVGERQRIKVPGFDFDNSPTEIIDRDFKDKTIIHTTTAGTKGLMAQSSNNEVVVGSFVNAMALVNYVKNEGIDKVNIYCTSNGEEDYYFATYLKSTLLGEGADFDSIYKTLKDGIGKGLSEEGIVPYSDFEYCMQLNRFNKILRRKIVNNGLYDVELEEVKQ